jgi:Flp pilus assembly protein TadG
MACRHPTAILRCRRGLSTLEFALVSPLLLLMCFAVVAYCLFFYQDQSLRIATAYYARDCAISAETTGATTSIAVPPLPPFSDTSITLSCSSTALSATDTISVTTTGRRPFALPIPFVPVASGNIAATTTITFLAYPNNS